MSGQPRVRRQSVSVVSGGGGGALQSTQSTIRDAASLSSAISTLKNENILLKCDSCRRCVSDVPRSTITKLDFSVFFRYGRNGKAELRPFFISQDCSSLQWRGKSGEHFNVELP